jgi:hypothetical protein
MADLSCPDCSAGLLARDDLATLKQNENAFHLILKPEKKDQVGFQKVATLGSKPVNDVMILKIFSPNSDHNIDPRGQVFKTSIGANSRVVGNSAKCHRCVGASSPRRRKNPFKKLASGPNPTIVSYNASAVKNYNATSRLVRLENKNISFYEKCFSRTLAL